MPVATDCHVQILVPTPGKIGGGVFAHEQPSKGDGADLGSPTEPLPCAMPPTARADPAERRPLCGILWGYRTHAPGRPASRGSPAQVTPGSEPGSYPL